MPGRVRRLMARRIEAASAPRHGSRAQAERRLAGGPLLAGVPVLWIAFAIAAVLVLAAGVTAGLRSGAEQGVLGERDAGSPAAGAGGEIAFGTSLDAVSGEVAEEATTFEPGEPFAYSLRLDRALGAPTVNVEVLHLEDGEETVVQPPTAQAVDAGGRIVAFVVEADALIAAFGTGDFEMRVYRGEELIGSGRFRLRDGS